MTCTSSRLLVAALLLLTVPSAAPQSGVRPAAPADSPITEGKKDTFKCEVLFLTRQAITVRDQGNYNLVRTFTYGNKLSEEIGKMFDKDQVYQYGDKIEIEFLSGTDTAIAIKGKPTRPPRS